MKKEIQGKIIAVTNHWHKDCDCVIPVGKLAAIQGGTTIKQVEVIKGKNPYEDESVFEYIYNPNPCCTVCGKQWRLEDNG